MKFFGKNVLIYAFYLLVLFIYILHLIFIIDIFVYNIDLSNSPVDIVVQFNYYIEFY